jgi:peptidoglycan/LPS O-acetylase OafA/YrhL
MMPKRLVSIDSLRGLAATTVVLHHVFLPHAASQLTSNPLDVIGEFATLGFAGVWLFIVISGYCIHLRAAERMKSGVKPTIDFCAFWKRRIYRLYPAYLAALLFYILILRFQGMIQFDSSFFYNLLLHLLMLHNLDPSTVHGICGVFWSLALEEQLYLAYFVLLPLRMRAGWKVTLMICFAARFVTYSAHYVIKHRYGIEMPTQALVTSQWFVWALGALSVEAYFGVVQLPNWCRDIRAALVVLVLTAAFFLFDRHNPESVIRKPFWFFLDPLVAIGFFILVNYFVESEKTLAYARLWSFWLKFFAFIGLFSYSLYLTHQMILIHLSVQICSEFGSDHSTLLLLLLSPMCFILGLVFYHVFEKPFMVGRKKALASTGNFAAPLAAASSEIT